jgi:AcrR family transcriptional regulator
MPRTNGEITKQKILAAAEALFAKKGLSATSVDEISRHANVNKALIYYYFKSKEELALYLLSSATEKVISELPSSVRGATPTTDRTKTILGVLEQNKDKLAILFMESLRQGPASDFLFETCEKFVPQKTKKTGNSGRKRMKALTRHFYQGTIPYLVFLAIADKWCTHFKCSYSQAKADFIEVLLESRRG